MKKMLLVLLCIVALAGFAMAQSYVPNEDVLGAHNNGGRGCAGCHQPHSGAGGAGSGAAATGTGAINNSGDDALFGQDLGPLYGKTLNFGGKGEFVVDLPANSNTIVGTEEVRGIMMCLACHDGSVAQGAMMQNSAYEQRMGLLPADLYGTGTIPTLLGADGRGTGYYNDHPIGKMATLGAAHLGTGQLTITINADNTIGSITPVASSAYANFVTDYGMPAIEGTSWAWGVAVNDTIAVGGSIPGCTPTTWNPCLYTEFDKVYLTCTTCHNQHSMNVYSALAASTGKPGIAGSHTGTYRTYFFVNAPYNVGATAGMVTPTGGGTATFNNKASSATQFCRQCHFSTSNESYGLNLATQF